MEKSETKNSKKTIIGDIKKIFFFDAKSGRSILSVLRDNGKYCRLIGKTNSIEKDSTISATGSWVKDEKYGWQFIAESIEIVTKKNMVAELDSAVEQFNLGLCYDTGQGVEQDYSKAAQWYMKAAEQGFAAAQFNLAICYSNGQGVEQDYSKAAQWYMKAADQGVANAQYVLGLAYARGLGVTKNEEKATNWFVKAAEQGHARGSIQSWDMLQIWEWGYAR